MYGFNLVDTLILLRSVAPTKRLFYSKGVDEGKADVLILFGL